MRTGGALETLERLIDGVSGVAVVLPFVCAALIFGLPSGDQRADTAVRLMLWDFIPFLLGLFWLVAKYNQGMTNFIHKRGVRKLLQFSILGLLILVFLEQLVTLVHNFR
jgi:hypothetical protein